MMIKVKYAVVLIFVIFFIFDSPNYGQEQSDMIVSNNLEHEQNAISFLFNDRFDLSYKRLYSDNVYLSFTLFVSRHTEYQWWNQIIGNQKIHFSDEGYVNLIGIRLQVLYDFYNSKTFKLNLGIGPILFSEFIYHETFNHNSQDFNEYTSHTWNFGFSTTTGAEIRAYREFFLTAGYEIVVNYYNKKSDLQSGRGWQIELKKLMLGATLYF